MTEPPITFAPRGDGSHKGNYGRVLLVGGSRGMSGSISLSAIAALRTGSGLVTAAVPDRCLETVASYHPGIMTVPLPDDSLGRFSDTAAERMLPLCEGKHAIGIGPGMTTAGGSSHLVDHLLERRTVPRVIDADALNVLAKTTFYASTDDAGPMVLTPHPGEWERLSGVSAGDRQAQIVAAESFAARTGVVIVLKGGPTEVVSAEPSTNRDGQDAGAKSGSASDSDRVARRWTNTTGNPGMASAGSGDVLTGVITSLLGQGFLPADAARLGVWLHGHAGDLAAAEHGQIGMTCREILECLCEAMRAAE